MFCLWCGNKVQPGYKFCPACGRSLPDVTCNGGAENGCAMPTAEPRGNLLTPSRMRESRTEQASAPLPMPFWKRLLKRKGLSVAECCMTLVVGLLVCGIGYVISDATHGFEYVNMRDSEFYDKYGRVGLSGGGWFVFVFGCAINFAGILAAYLGLTAWLQKIRPANRQESIGAKLMAIILCMFVFVCFSAVMTLCFDGAHMSVWDYLIMFAIWSAIWRGIVGGKPSK